MAKNTANLFDTNPIYKAWYDALEYLAKDTGDRIENAYQESISEFYAHYTPKSYGRTENLRRASSGYGKNRKHYRSINNNTAFRAGIRVGGNYIHDRYVNNPNYPYMTNDWIFWRAFSEGIHGYSEEDVKIHNMAAELGQSKKAKKSKLRKHFTEVITWYPDTIPPVMSPPPESHMNEKFDQIINHTIMLRKFTRRFNINLRKIQ